MANLKGFDLKKGKIGANILTENIGISGLVITSPEITGLTFGAVTPVYNIVDVEKLGITPEFDTENNVNVYRHLSEFYRLGVEGQKLYLMVLPVGTTMVDIVKDENIQYAKKLLIEANGEVRKLGIALNITEEPTVLNGFNSDVYNSIALAQELHKWAYERFMPCNILLEGSHYAGNASTTANLRDLENIFADKVSIVIGQDWNYANTKTGLAQKFGDVGSALGTLSICELKQNMGDNEDFNLTDAGKEAWLVPGLSSHQRNVDVYTDLQTLEDKGYIFGLAYTGLAGVRWNNDHVCTPIIQDAQDNINEHTISYGQVMDETTRLLRTAYLPKLKKKYPVEESGKLDTGLVRYLESIGDDVFARLVNERQISEGKTYVDPDSDLLVKKQLNIRFKVRPYGSMDEINGTINLTTSI